MDYNARLALSYYKTIAVLNGSHMVYLVQHKECRKIYVRKILDVYNPHIYEYLQSHPVTGIPKIYEVYEEDSRLTIIEEYISGASLQELADSHELSSGMIPQIMCELCDILGRLHSLEPPIIHRDIKPSNIIITPCGHAMLIDFNAAKYMTDRSRPDTVLLGTKGYAAPEQYGFGSSTPQTDIYALGVLLRELTSALPEPTHIFDSVISKCTQINPSDRIENVHDLKSEIEAIEGHRDPKPSRSSMWKKYAPPGFRTGTPWKMLCSSVVYVFVICLALTLDASYASIFDLWIQRIIFLLMMLTVIGCCFNYLNIQRCMPLCASRCRPVRYLGILIIAALLLFALFSVMSLFV